MKSIKREHIDEFLELLFVAKEENVRIKADNIPDKLPCFDAGVELKNISIEELISACEKKQYIKFNSDNTIDLTETGLRKATAIVRKHRLSERLLLDILELKEILMEKNACVFEHHLSSVVADRICIILNHPPECPHGKPIPKGNCCKEENERLEPAVISLKNASLSVAYKVIFTKGFDTKTFLMLKSFAIYPGSVVKVLQKYPEMVVEIDNSKVALERKVAEDIYVLPIEDEETGN
jgi:DtxR family Mn-dependent transcriptional regulator